MKRYASIDFLRGFAIWMMVFVHSLQRWVNLDDISSKLGQLPMFIFVFLLAAIFFGGWAGFFLLISATGNMISIYKSTKRAGKPGDVILKQLIGGVILLFFAMMTESLTGYHGNLGEIALGNTPNFLVVLSRSLHMETIHTVAVCIIWNAVVQGILSINGGWKRDKIKRNIRIYIVLAIIVIFASVFVWEGVRFTFPGILDQTANPIQYPFGIPLGGGEDLAIQYGILGVTPFWQLVKQFFLMPLAGSPEPLFPFLAVSFMGSAIGLWLMQKEEEKEENPEKLPSSRPLTRVMIIGFVMFIVGLVIVAVLAIMSNLSLLDGTLTIEGIDYNIGIISHHYDVRRLYEDGLMYGQFKGFTTIIFNPYTYLWLGWFLIATGAQLGCFTLILRAVEFRGKAKQFGRKTLYFRRFGHVAFSIYNYQFVDVLVPLIFALIGWGLPFLQIPGSGEISNGWTAIISSANKGYSVIHIWFLIAGVFLLHQLLLKIWEKFNYTGGFEWAIAKIAGILVPSKRKDKKKEGFFYSGRLDAKKALITPQWIEIIPYDKVQHKDLVDSKLASKLCWLGLFIPPLSLVALGISRTAIKTEGINKYSKRGLIVSSIAVSLSAIIIALLFVFKGIAL